MQGDDPPFLPVGTDVSAKYKGAFCEAKVKKVVRNIKCKLTLKAGGGTIQVNDDVIKGILRVGNTVEVKPDPKKEAMEAIITKIQDCSQYTVVFDDGDITTLRRSALCLKSGRHFNESETLDQLPLTHPEHFSTPVIAGRRGRRGRALSDESEGDSSTAGSSSAPRRAKAPAEPHAGRVVLVEAAGGAERRRPHQPAFPALVVAPTPQIKVKEDYLVRSFKDGRYYTVPKKEAREFRKGSAPPEWSGVQAALQYLGRGELPPHWDRDALFNEPRNTSDDSSDDEPREEKDHFVAQLYKFMDDRGTPLNRNPTIANRDVDLYRLFRVVEKLGGYNRVTNQNQWKTIAGKMGFHPVTTSITNLCKQAYKKFLHSFEDFYRKLGVTLVAHPRGARTPPAGRSLIRDRDKQPPAGAATPPHQRPKDKDSDKSETEKSEKSEKEEKVEKPDKAKETKRSSDGEESADNQPLVATAPKVEKEKEKEKEIEKEKEKEKEKEREKEKEKEKDKEKEKEKKEEKDKDIKPTPTAAVEEREMAKSRSHSKTRSVTKLELHEKRTPKRRPLSKMSESASASSRASRRPHVSTDSDSSGRASRCGLTKKMQSRRSQSANSASSGNTIASSGSKRPRKRKITETSTSEPARVGAGNIKAQVGDKLKVYYGPAQSESKVTYEAKVIEVSPEGALRVHYTGWNTRYDEWIKPQRIAVNVTDQESRNSKNTSISRRARAKRTEESSARSDSDSDSDSEVDVKRPPKKSDDKSSTKTPSRSKDAKSSDSSSSSKSRKRPMRAVSAPSNATPPKKLRPSTSSHQGRDYDLNEIRSELKGLHTVKQEPEEIKQEVVEKEEIEVKPPAAPSASPPTILPVTPAAVPSVTPAADPPVTPGTSPPITPAAVPPVTPATASPVTSPMALPVTPPAAPPEPPQPEKQPEDVYEFKEPEPFELELHDEKKKRTHRIFDDISPSKYTLTLSKSLSEEISEDPLRPKTSLRSPSLSPFRDFGANRETAGRQSPEDDTKDDIFSMDEDSFQDGVGPIFEGFTPAKNQETYSKKSKVSKLRELIDDSPDSPDSPADDERSSEDDIEDVTMKDEENTSSPIPPEIEPEIPEPVKVEPEAQAEEIEPIKEVTPIVITQVQELSEDELLIIPEPPTTPPALEKDEFQKIESPSTSDTTRVVEPELKTEELKPKEVLEEKKEDINLLFIPLPSSDPKEEKTAIKLKIEKKLDPQTVTEKILEPPSSPLIDTEEDKSEPDSPARIDALPEPPPGFLLQSEGPKIAEKLLKAINSAKRLSMSPPPVEVRPSTPKTDLLKITKPEGKTSPISPDLKSTPKIEVKKSTPEIGDSVFGEPSNITDAKRDISEIKKVKPKDPTPPRLQSPLNILERRKSVVDLPLSTPGKNNKVLSDTIQKLSSQINQSAANIPLPPFPSEDRSESSDSDDSDRRLIIDKLSEDWQSGGSAESRPLGSQQASTRALHSGKSAGEWSAGETLLMLEDACKNERKHSASVVVAGSGRVAGGAGGEDDSNLSLLLCSETIPGSPAPDAEPAPPRQRLAMPFACAPPHHHHKGEERRNDGAGASRAREGIAGVDGGGESREAGTGWRRAMLDNTPPTTPDSSLDMSPMSHRERRISERDSPCDRKEDDDDNRNDVDMEKPHAGVRSRKASESSGVLGAGGAGGAGRGRRRRRDTEENPHQLSSHPPPPLKYNFYVELDPSWDSPTRINILTTRLADLRKAYHSVKAELAAIDRRRKKLRRKEREAVKAAKAACS